MLNRLFQLVLLLYQPTAISFH